MIGLITGLPGNGKTLWALNFIKAKAEKEGRPVYYSGIADLMLPWTEIDGEKWMECPPNSIIVIDECQRIYRPRSHGSNVPPHVSELETHRHKGVDIFLITQHPMLVDSNVRRLVGLHFHCVRKFGTQSATVHEWSSVKENCDKNREGSTRHDFMYPKEAYSWYKSAEVHTHKARIPMKVWILLSVPFIVAGLGWFTYARWQAKIHGDDTSASQSAPVAVPGPASAGRAPVRTGPVSAPDYVAQYAPRVRGLEYTAPAYDEVTKPVRAPYPAACVTNKKRCNCYSQQGTRLDVPRDMCEQIADGGFFMAWDEAGRAIDNPDARRHSSSQVRPDPVETPYTQAIPLSRRQVALADTSPAIVQQDPARPRVRR